MSKINSRLKLRSIAQLVVILAIAYGLKYFYSTASVNDLRWILAPTTLAVEIITGDHFTFESQAGYMSADHTFLIAASCSGVNFLIISFVTLSLVKFWQERKIEWRDIPLALLAAYVATLIANTMRIVVALYLRWIDLSFTGLAAEEIHRVEGIIVYFGFLLLLFFVTDKRTRDERNSATMTASVSHWGFALAIYYGITLGIPILRGRFHDPSFWQHAPFVVFIPLGLALVLFAVGWARSKAAEFIRQKYCT